MRRPDQPRRDLGHQAVGHVLLVSVVAGSTLVVARLAALATAGFEQLLAALS